MSEATKKAMEEAMSAHFADEREAIMTGYFLTMKGKSVEDLERENTRYTTTAPDHMEYDQVLGLARFGLLDVERGMYEDEDD